MEKGGKVRCQRIGCDAMFTDDDNLEGSCRYHDSPIFHDGMKEWSCCKQRSHDFSLFLAIPGKNYIFMGDGELAPDPIHFYGDTQVRGSKSGKHTTEKPVTKAVSSASSQKPVPSAVQNKTSDVNCSRCRQGFFCSDHGAQPRPSKPAVVPTVAENDHIKITPAPVKKIVGLDEPQTCRNKGCGKTFKEKDNHETACEYHPGPAIFHDRIRGWKCCDIHVKEFDEFMNIPPCTKGWHNADAA